MKIGTLIVDDEEDIRLLIRMIIEGANEGLFVSGEAASGSDAISRADELDPQVVVLDERMPGVSGIDAAKEILARRPHQRILMCSAHLDADLRRRAEEAGIHACITKGEVHRIPDALWTLVGGERGGGIATA